MSADLAAPADTGGTGRRTLTWVLAVGCCVPLLVAAIHTPLNVYDEGNLLTAAQRILGGDVPYRDFWSAYPPGQMLVVAGVMSVTGDDLLGPRIYDVGVRAATVLVTYLLARRASTSRPLAAVAAAVCAIELAAVGRHYLYPVGPAYLLALTALLLWLVALQHPSTAGRSGAAVASGVVLGLAALVRWDIAAYAALGLAVASALAARGGQQETKARARQVLVRGGLASAGTAAAGYLALAAVSGVGPVWTQVFWFPATTLHDARGLPYPRPWDVTLSPASIWAQFYLPVVGLLVVVALCLHGQLRGRRVPGPGAYATLAVGVFGLASFAQALSRTDRSHLLPTTLATVLALAMLVARRGSSDARRPRWLDRLVATALAVVVVMTSYVGLRVVVRDARTYSPLSCLSALDAASCVSITPDQQAAIRFIQSTSDPSDRIFVANSQNERINVNDSSFYFLSARLPATPYEELHPGVADTAPVQRSIVDDLRRTGTRWVVLVDMPDSHEPNLSSKGFGVTTLDDYLRQGYVPRASYGTYHVLEARAGLPR